MRRRVLGVLAGAALFAALSAAPGRGQQPGLAGVWRITGADSASELAIMPDGRFSKFDTNHGAQTVISGAITVMPNPPILRLNIQDWSPKQFCGPLGCVPIQMIASETYRFELRPEGLLLSDERGQYLFRRVH